MKVRMLKKNQKKMAEVLMRFSAEGYPADTASLAALPGP
jgi:hypothetical protein